MAVQFILGRSGTGKTSYCIESIRDVLLNSGEQQLILLVPEQANKTWIIDKSSKNEN